jgi:predicted ferric reductase
MPVPVLVASFLVAALLPLSSAWVQDSSGHLPTELGAAFAILAATLLFLQFLSSGRFEALSGKIGIDRTMGFHRIAAYALVCFALAHPLSYVGLQVFENPRSALAHLGGMLASARLRSGVIALSLLLVLVGFATIRTKPYVRYELWRASHGPLAIVVGALTLHHALSAGTYSADGAVRAIWTVYALVAVGASFIVYARRPWRMWREEWRVEKANIVANGVTELVLKGPQDTTLKPRGGQFVWLTIAPHRPPFHDHPFSIASSSSLLPRLRFFVRHVGDCTNHFHGLPTGTRVAIDGPHGSFVLPDETSSIVMVAGGVGIAPLLGILEDAADRRDSREFRLLYAARSMAALAGTDELGALSSRLHLKVIYCIDEACSLPGILQGPLSTEHLKGLCSQLPLEDTSVLLCGPAPMMELTSDAFLELGTPSRNIHYERFDYGAGHGRIDKWRRFTALKTLAVALMAVIAFSVR